MNIRTISPEVYQAEGPVVRASAEQVRFLKERAASNPRGRARLCAHPGPEDPTHEMLVVLRADNWIRPHYHTRMVESFHCIEGEMLVLLFREDGSVLETIRMGDQRSGRDFYYRQTVPLYHTLIVLTDFVVFQEVTQGPFRRENTILAPWAPAEGTDELRGYIQDLRARYLGS